MSDKQTLLNLGRIQVDHFRVCHAPFNNLFFGNRGFVMACCSNRLHVLGKYPAQSISDIWTGAKATELREAISKNDFSKGCMGCGILYENKNFSGMPATAYDGHKHTEPQWPKRMEFELSNTCNLECVMCTGEFSSAIHERRDRKPSLPNPYDDFFIEQLRHFIPHLQSARFVGGEPFLIPVYMKIWEIMTELNPAIQINIQTNGTVLNQRVKRVLEGLTASISVSIDSLDVDTYKAIRVNGHLGQTLENIDFFSDYCSKKGTHFSLSFCPMKNNWKEIGEIALFANSKKASVFYNTVYYPAQMSLTNLPESELVEIVKWLEIVELPEQTYLEKLNKRKFEDQINEIKSFGRKANVQTPIVADFITLPDYLQRIRTHVYSKAELNDAEKQAKYESIADKLTGIVGLAEHENRYDDALKGLNALSEDTIYQFVPGLENIERAYELFRERILKSV